MSAAIMIEWMIPPRITLGDITAQTTALFTQSAGDQPRETMAEHSTGGRSLLRIYCDSFDWRLYRKGLVLFAETLENQSRLVCTVSSSNEILATCTLATPMPRFAWELPDERLRARLAPILDVRALLPKATIRCVGSILETRKEEFCLIFATCHAIDGAMHGSRPLGDWLIAEASKSARRTLREWLNDLGDGFGWESSEPSLLQQALTAISTRPEDPTRSAALMLEPAERADQATKQILRRLLAAIEVNETGVIQRLDSEFLHDYRIAVRRTRSALGQIKGVFPDRTVERFNRRFAWLGQITGPARDLDVYLLGFEELKGKLPSTLRTELEPLRRFLEQRAELAHAKLARNLGSGRYRALLIGWKKFLDTPVARRPRAAHALMPIRELAGRRIWKTYRRALKQGHAIKPTTPAENLHQLRKTCKKLRYLLEFFQSLYPPEKIRQLLKQLKGFQDYLGKFQDIHAQIATLHQFSLEMRGMSAVPTDTLLAMGALLAQLDQQQNQLRQDFDERFAEFTRPEHQVRFRRLFATRPESAED